MRNGRDARGALQLFGGTATELQPNVITCTTVSSAGGQTFVLLGQMRQRELRPNAITYTTGSVGG